VIIRGIRGIRVIRGCALQNLIDRFSPYLFTARRDIEAAQRGRINGLNELSPNFKEDQF
jgi:hypothetical protein